MTKRELIAALAGLPDDALLCTHDDASDAVEPVLEVLRERVGVTPGGRMRRVFHDLYTDKRTVYILE